MDRLTRDTVSGTALVVLAASYYLGARSLPDGPATFPRLLSLALLVIGGVIAARGARSVGSDRLELARPFALIGLTVLYGVLFIQIGFVPATLVYAAASAWFFGLPGARALVTGVAVTGGLYLLFEVGLRAGLT